MNEQKGNMYGFVTHTWNAIKGKCPHDCSYCYMKAFKQKDLRLDKKELTTDLGKDNFIFVGSSCDMFADDIPGDWIREVLRHCPKFDNRYLFQSKNPRRMHTLKDYIPSNSVLGTTIETNWDYKAMGNAPHTETRAIILHMLSKEGFDTMVTVEPIMDFKLEPLVRIIKLCKPSWVNIGADSKGHKLPEPSPEKINALICELEKFTEVKIKDNLKRLRG